MNDRVLEPKAVFGVLEIKDECHVESCSQPAVATFPISTRAETGIWWFCEEHADQMQEIGNTSAVSAVSKLQAVSRTCLFGDTDRPCGATATHAVIVGSRDEQGHPELVVVSACPRHARRNRQTVSAGSDG